MWEGARLAAIKIWKPMWRLCEDKKIIWIIKVQVSRGRTDVYADGIIEPSTPSLNWVNEK